MKRIENKHIIDGRDNYNKFLKLLLLMVLKKFFIKEKLTLFFLILKTFLCLILVRKVWHQKIK